MVAVPGGGIGAFLVTTGGKGTGASRDEVGGLLVPMDKAPQPIAAAARPLQEPKQEG